jgi:hypothetical protein
MNEQDLSPMPTPTTEDPELYPGGVDALAEDPADNGLGRDLSPEDNPAVDDVLPDEISAADDKPQAPEGKADDAEAGTTSEDPKGQDAGQEAEDGSVEPPA